MRIVTRLLVSALVWHPVAALAALESTQWEPLPAGLEEAEFVAIGVNAALALANQRDLEPRLRAFCAAYGLAFQLVDDLLEVAADRGTGYHSPSF